ncbi:peroxide stress protein YaaA [Mycobacterium sp. 1274756.6]|uniref:peroxide stress protein YaaA n=1 Tax=Mycobacterium sp. 1274756.6 TaxID=1834076 RepID=UPI00080237D8|nr:peroxide stress protein YaaA [Mycobacterium sp. 1274756.6]OBJ68229.1 hypothetical protein A5643_13855 [Mycobacterium sp. 1274756.6]
MILVLPPSETKHAGGDGPPLRLDALGFPTLTPLRAELVDEVVALAGDLAGSRRALGLTARQDAEIARNAVLWEAATMPAIQRYTGVLYDALDAGALRGAQAGRARNRLVVASALFGLLRADDPIPAYRLSAGSRLPDRPGLAPRWRPVLEPVFAALAGDQLVVDLRSGPYAALARIPGAVKVVVVAESPDGRRTAVSHASKAHKGRLARVLAVSRAEPTDAAGAAAIARRAGLTVEHRPGELTVIVAA